MKLLDIKKRSNRVLRIEKVALDSETFVCVREVTAKERDRVDSQITTMKMVTNPDTRKQEPHADIDSVKFRKLMTLYSICDESGKSLLSERDFDPFMDAISPEEFGKIWEACAKVNRLGDDVVLETAKNSETEQLGDSASS